MTGKQKLYPYSYATLRAVPRVERGEFVNIGVIIYCQDLDFLRARADVAPERILALDPKANIELIIQAAESVVAACTEPVGTNRENSGLVTRFGMLTAPRSTVVQPSPVHTGLTADPIATLDQLVRLLVLPPD
ncbi:DUF3037 domain-containing protein [Microlunatus sp. Gsoil 973]|uniref:DUF3037 domain-containing protein n=1 Tax=Microlunatus sp. Gsoil 973 TaxID=2672569 RepID=UPI001E3D9DC8|nr:DUF3037 domain-containing protein [Microlunatus sp. Gsoil 973]